MGEAEAWVERVASLLGGRTREVEQRLEAEVSQLRARLSELQRPDEMESRRDALQRELQQTRIDRASLVEAIAETEQAAEQTIRARTQAVADGIEHRLASCQAALDAEIVEEAGRFLEWRDIDRQPAAMVEARITQLAPVLGEYRARVASRVQAAALRSAEIQDVLAEEEALEERKQSLEREERETRSRLEDWHRIDPAVMQALADLPDVHARRLLSDFVEPRLADAHLEETWSIPKDVLAEVRHDD